MLLAATLAMSGGSARSEPGAPHLARSCQYGLATVIGADDADFADIWLVGDYSDKNDPIQGHTGEPYSEKGSSIKGKESSEKRNTKNQ